MHEALHHLATVSTAPVKITHTLTDAEIVTSKLPQHDRQAVPVNFIRLCHPGHSRDLDCEISLQEQYAD